MSEIIDHLGATVGSSPPPRSQRGWDEWWRGSRLSHVYPRLRLLLTLTLDCVELTHSHILQPSKA
jgi:hypothetical protein